MELIDNDSARKASFNKRKLGLLKKVEELTTLCGIKACLIIYSPEENDPVAWPSHDEIVRLLEKFHLEPEMERSKKSMNMETYNTERLSKLKDQLVKLQRKKKEGELGDMMLQVHQGKMLVEFNVNDLSGLIWLIETRYKELRNCIDFHKLLPSSSVTLSEGDVAPVSPPQGPVGHDLDRSNFGIGDGEEVTIDPLLWEDWFDITGEARSSSAHSDMGLRTYNPYDPSVVKNLGFPGPSFGGIGSSSVAPHLELPGPSYGGSSGIAPDFGMPGHSFRGNLSVAPDVGESRPLFVGGSSSSVVAADLQLPGPSFGDTSSAASHHAFPTFENFIDPTIDMGLFEGEIFSSFGGHDMGPGHYPFGPLGSGSPISEFRDNQQFGVFDGESSSSGAARGNIMEPSDDKNLSNNP